MAILNIQTTLFIISNRKKINKFEVEEFKETKIEGVVSQKFKLFFFFVIDRLIIYSHVKNICVSNALLNIHGE